MTTIKKMLLSFTAGAVLGILYAPQKGSKTRRRLAEVGTDIKEGWNNITEGLTEKIDGFRQSVDNFADSTIEKVESTQFEVNDRAGYL